jgi:type II restriction enzyme
MLASVLDGTAPTLMMLERDSLWAIQSLTAIHHSFLTPNVIVERKPLSTTARRAGWVGCNIRLDLIVAEAQVEVIGNRGSLAPNSVREAFRRFEPLSKIGPRSRGWTTLTLKVLRGMGRKSFSLDDLYDKEPIFTAAYPDNRNIRPKIRQQLQVLRDLRFVEFLGNGNYSLLI